MEFIPTLSTAAWLSRLPLACVLPPPACALAFRLCSLPPALALANRCLVLSRLPPTSALAVTFLLVILFVILIRTSRLCLHPLSPCLLVIVLVILLMILLHDYILPVSVSMMFMFVSVISFMILFMCIIVFLFIISLFS